MIIFRSIQLHCLNEYENIYLMIIRDNFYNFFYQNRVWMFGIGIAKPIVGPVMSQAMRGLRINVRKLVACVNK